MGKKVSMPAAPDPVATTNAQSAINADTARLQGRMNNPNVYNPYGSQTVSWDGQSYANPTLLGSEGNMNKVGYGNETFFVPQSLGNIDESAYRSGDVRGMNGVKVYQGTSDQPTVTQTLSPAQQTLLDAQNRIDNRLAGMGENQLQRIDQSFSQPFNLPETPNLSDFDQYGKEVQDAIMSRLEPQLQRDQESLRTQLVNQGLTQNMEAYGRDMDTFNRSKNDARAQAVIQGLNTRQQLYENALRARQQGIQEQSMVRNMPLNELTALLSGTQVNMPQFQSYQGSQVQPANYQQAVGQNYQAGLNAANAQQGANNAMTSGLFQLGGAALMGNPFGMFGAGAGMAGRK